MRGPLWQGGPGHTAQWRRAACAVQTPKTRGLSPKQPEQKQKGEKASRVLLWVPVRAQSSRSGGKA